MQARSFEDLAHSQEDFHQTFGHVDDDDADDDEDDDNDDDKNAKDDDNDDDVNLAMIHSMISSS